MDADMRSPSFRTPRSGKSKRPRSPPSPSLYERPNKRVLLNGIPATSLPQYLSSPLVLAPPAVQERQVSEDWVTRTRTLSIESYQLDRDQCLKMVPVAETLSQDENMNIDPDENTNSSELSHKQQIATSAPSHESFSSHSSSLSLSSPLSSDLDTFNMTSPLSHTTIPSSMSLQSYAPSAASSEASFPSPQTRSSSNFSSPAHTPAPTYEHVPASTNTIPASIKKPRFTMGPRADCEKCRLGVPGHWAHFD